MPANDKQVGGTHYQLPYQHWDWVQDAGLTYLQGQATKYLARYPQTKSLEDLRKALHYEEKIDELKLTRIRATLRFTDQFQDRLLRDAIKDIGTGGSARDRIELLIERHMPVPLSEENHHGERLVGGPQTEATASFARSGG